MNYLLWTLIILGIFEVGGAIAYLTVERWPERTKTTIVINLIFWIGMAAWAYNLL